MASKRRERVGSAVESEIRTSPSWKSAGNTSAISNHERRERDKTENRLRNPQTTGRYENVTEARGESDAPGRNDLKTVGLKPDRDTGRPGPSDENKCFYLFGTYGMLENGYLQSLADTDTRSVRVHGS